jgi:hypothetical protein
MRKSSRKVNSLRISVRTEFMRLIVFALTLAPSWPPPPKEGSFCAALPQPTGWWTLVLACCSRGLEVCCGGAIAGVDILRARKRSSERTAMAFMRRTETGGPG